MTLRTGRVVASRGRNDKRRCCRCRSSAAPAARSTNSAYHEVDIVTRDDLLCHFAANFRIELIVALCDLHWTARNLAATLLEERTQAVSDAFAEIRVNPGIRQDQTYFERIGAERITESRRRRDSGPAQRERCLGKGASEKVMSLVMLVLQQFYVYLQKFQFDHNLAPTALILSLCARPGHTRLRLAGLDRRCARRSFQSP